MKDSDSQSGQNATPEDVATLYSWANLHGAKYRDFSAARAQTREKARLRAEQSLAAEKTMEEERPLSEQEVGAAQAEEAECAAEEARAAEQSNEQSNEQADREAAEQAARQETERAHQEAYEALLAAELVAQQAEQASPRAAEQAVEETAQQAAEPVAEQATEQASEQASEPSAEQASEQSAEQPSEQAAEEFAQSAAEQQSANLEAEQEAEQEAQQAARQAAQEAEQKAAQEADEEAEQGAAHQAQELARQRAEQLAAQQAAQQAADRVAEQTAQQIAQQRAWQQSRAERSPVAPPSAPNPFVPPAAPSYSPPQPYRPSTHPFASQPPFGPPRDEKARQERAREDRAREDRVKDESSMPRTPWATPDVREPASRPAWLTTETQETSTPSVPQSTVPQPPLPQAPVDTLQGSRDRLTSRWFALRGVFDGAPPQPVEPIPIPQTSRPPAMAIFSLAGGVGKTSLVATLGRALSARGERVLLVDTAAFGLLPFFFGATDQRPGLLRTFSPPGASSDAPIQMVTLDPEGLNPETAGQEGLSGEILKFAHGASRIIVDLATASGATTRRIMRMGPLVLVPIIPDMNSVVSVSSIDAFFEHNGNPQAKPALPYYVLNQFDASLPLHLDVREVLREQLGERLLPFALRRAAAMSEALAEGMTVVDYAPGSMLADDFSNLAGWVKSLSSPATTSYRGVRWSER